MSTETKSGGRRGPIPRALGGAGLLLRGFGLWATSPRLMLLGLLPALITAALFVVILVVLAYQLDGITGWLTLWASGWDADWRGLLRAVIAIAIAGGCAILLALSFTAVALAIGAPFFDAIAARVDTLLGVGETADPPFWRALGRGLLDALMLVLIAAAGGLLLFLVGLIPVAGSAISTVAGAIFGGWLLGLELSGVAGERRGMRLRDRRRLLAGDRATSLGFGIAVFLLFLIPFGALLGMPAAVSGATLLIRRLRGEPVSGLGPAR